MSILEPPPPPPTKLAIYRQLSPLAGVHVSPLCLGAMSIGDKWDKFGMGAMNKETSFALLDAFHAAGGNFVDTANNYQDESSEEFLGEWMESRGIRDQIVVATKVGHRDSPARRRGVCSSLGAWLTAVVGSIRRRSSELRRISCRRSITRGTT